METKKQISKDDAVKFAAKAVEDAGRELKIILDYADCDHSEDKNLKDFLIAELPRKIENLNNIKKNLNGGKEKLKLDRNFIADEFYNLKNVYNYLCLVSDILGGAGSDNPEAFVDMLQDSIGAKIDFLGGAINGLTGIFDGLEQE